MFHVTIVEQCSKQFMHFHQEHWICIMAKQFFLVLGIASGYLYFRFECNQKRVTYGILRWRPSIYHLAKLTIRCFDSVLVGSSFETSLTSSVPIWIFFQCELQIVTVVLNCIWSGYYIENLNMNEITTTTCNVPGFMAIKIIFVDGTQ